MAGESFCWRVVDAAVEAAGAVARGVQAFDGLAIFVQALVLLVHPTPVQIVDTRIVRLMP